MISDIGAMFGIADVYVKKSRLRWYGMVLSYAPGITRRGSDVELSGPTNDLGIKRSIVVQSNPSLRSRS